MAAWWRDGVMPSAAERIAYIEGRSDEHAAAIGEVRADVRDLRAEMIRRFEHIDGRFEHIDGRFDRIDGRFGHTDGRFEHIEQRLMWLAGLQFATLLAVISAVLGAYYR